MFNQNDHQRRNFLKQLLVTSFASTPAFSTLASLFNSTEEQIKALFDDEYHFFGNNLASLHFYFVNACIKGRYLKKINTDNKSYMVVRIPQQHISEQLLKEDQIDGYINNKEYTTTKISGFSYLSFEIKKDKIHIESPNVLIDWSNEENFTLVLPDPNCVVDFSNKFSQFTDNKWIRNEKNSISLFQFFKDICTDLFIGDFVPVTVLEIPQGLLTIPYAPVNQKGNVNDIEKDLKTKAVFSKPPISKEQFVYFTKNKKFVRSIQEIWNTRMWFQQFYEKDGTDRNYGSKYSPPLRPLAVIDDSTDNKNRVSCTLPDGTTRISECEDGEVTYLPQFLDKKELTFLAGLGRDADNKGKEWNIETKGLTFTGLGVISKFHYKNYQPPVGTSLAEYEHHFTMGRDEYIKVARLGIISVTGQRAVHVKTGQRKIRNGVSYLEFKEYVEIIQQEINYFDEKLFIDGDTELVEKYNYIQARTQESPKGVFKVIHSFDDIYDLPESQLNTNDKNDVWWDRNLWNDKFLPGKWNTHYRRWPFKKVNSITSVSTPICAKNLFNGLSTDCECDKAFWPEIQSIDNGNEVCGPDFEFEFYGTDWNDRKVRFSSTFLFISKTTIESLNETKVKKIYDEFFSAIISRRRIKLDVELAYTPDYRKSEEGLENKSNVSKTDFIEYYFGLCRENDGNLLKYDTVDRKIVQQYSQVNFTSLFNERFFPVFPQVRRMQVYLENIQGYTSSPVASIIEYSNDYIYFGFEQKTRNNNRGISSFKDTNGVEKESVYNKSKVIFNHTNDFKDGKILVQKFLNGEWIDAESKNGFDRIKTLSREAGAAIGGLVNPDFDNDVVGLIKQGNAIGRDVNKKYEELGGDSIKHFNPSDIFKQVPELFSGISLIDILKEVFPEIEAPFNEIKNIQGQIENLNSSLVNSEEFQSIQNTIKGVQDKLRDNIIIINNAKESIEELEPKVRSLKNQLDQTFNFESIKKFVQYHIDQYKIGFLEFSNEIVNIKSNISEIVNVIVNDLLSKVKAEYLIELHPKLLEEKSRLESILKYQLPDNTKFSDPAKGIITKYINNSYFGINRYLLIDLDVNASKILLEKENVDKAVSSLFEPQIKLFGKLLEKQKAEQEALSKYLKNTLSAILKQEYQEAEQEKKDVQYDLAKLFDFPDLIAELTLQAGKIPNDRIILNAVINDLNQIQSVAFQAFSIIKDFNLGYYLNQFSEAEKNIRSLRESLGSNNFDDWESFKTNIGNDSVLLKQIKNAKDKLSQFYKYKYDTLILKPRSALIYESAKYLDAYNYVTGPFIWEGLTQTLNPEVFSVLDPEGDIIERILSIKDMKDIMGRKLYDVKKDLNDTLKELNTASEDLQNFLKEQEVLIKQQISQTANGVVDKIRSEISRLESELMANPNNRDLYNNLLKIKQIYQVLTSLSRKEVNYSWKTSSFKSAEFGIVNFIASNEPKTELTVNVSSVIHFAPNKFPAVISKIETAAENKITNFSIGLLKAIYINFKEVSFTSGTNQKPKFEVKLGDVMFAGAFSFVKALEACFKELLGDNFQLKVQPLSIEISYNLKIDYIGAPSFGFRDISFLILYRLHFDRKPMEIGAGIGTPDNRTKLSVGIYTGLFYFIVIGNPKEGITSIEVSLEFGGYYGLSLGPLKGEVKLVVGLYYRKDPNGVFMEGYFLCLGRVKLWFVMITARFYMGVRSQGNYVEGRCTVSYQIRITRFYKRSFTATYYKKLAGSESGMQQGGRVLAAIGQPTIPLKRTTKPLSFNQFKNYLESYED